MLIVILLSARLNFLARVNAEILLRLKEIIVLIPGAILFLLCLIQNQAG